jgi:hypothetical protein
MTNRGDREMVAAPRFRAVSVPIVPAVKPAMLASGLSPSTGILLSPIGSTATTTQHW